MAKLSYSVSKDADIPHLLILLSMLYITFIYISSILLPKFFNIHGIIVTAQAFIFPITYVLGDIIAEVYGYKISKKIILYSFICLFLFDNLIPLITEIPYGLGKISSQTFKRILGHLPRLFLADLVAINIGAYLNVLILTKSKFILKGRYFWFRSLGSSAIGEAFFTMISFSIFFVGRRPFHIWIYAMITSYIFKLLFSLIAVIPASIAVNLIKKNQVQSKPSLSVVINPFKNVV